MFSWLAETVGQIVGETVHQTGKALEDVTDIPSKFMEGYDKELFSDKEQTTETSVEAGTEDNQG